MSICSVFRTRPIQEKTRGEPTRIHAVGQDVACSWAMALCQLLCEESIRGARDQLRSPEVVVPRSCRSPSCSARRLTTTRWQPVTVWLIELGQHRAQVARLSTLQKTVCACSPVFAMLQLA